MTVAAAATSERPVTALLRASGAGRRYGRRWAVRGASLDLQPGERLALVGPNGAGKTTLLALLAGSLAPSEGSVEGAAGAGFVPQRPAIWRRLTPRENLVLLARLQGLAAPARAAAALVERAGLSEVADRPCSQLSVGQQQRVNVAAGLLGDPGVVLLDEPTAALDPRQRLLLWGLLADVTGRGGGIVFTTQNVEEVGLHADRLMVLHEGRPAFTGTVEAFLDAAGPGREGVEAALVRFLDDLEEDEPAAMEGTPDGGAART